MEILNKKLINLDEFTQGIKIDQGAQGKIIVAKHNVDQQLYALKVINKKRILEMKQTDHIHNELRIMHIISHQNIVEFYGYCQDHYNIYYQLHLIRGINLYNYLKIKPLSLNQSLFYITQIVSSLECLHNQQIIYRDLKPENIMIDKSGYIKLTDFGMSKIVDKSGRTQTFCGTPEYMAPEVVKNEGTTKAVDFWSLGVMFYEMLTGLTPFHAKDELKIYRNILEDEDIIFPRHIDKNVKKLLSSLLQKDPTRRVEKFDNKIENLLKDPVFVKVNLTNILNQSELPLYIPLQIDDKDYMLGQGIRSRQQTIERLDSQDDPFLKF